MTDETILKAAREWYEARHAYFQKTRDGGDSKPFFDRMANAEHALNAAVKEKNNG